MPCRLLALYNSDLQNDCALLFCIMEESQRACFKVIEESLSQKWRSQMADRPTNCCVPIILSLYVYV